MKTYKQMQERLKWYVGRYIDFDGVYQAQCMDLTVDFMWWATDGKYRMLGNAIDAINTNVNKYGNYATIHRNTATFLPQVGDIAVWTKAPAHEVYGHIGIVYGDINLNTCTMLDQNWDGDPSRPAKLRTDDYQGVSHFVRINFDGVTAPSTPSASSSKAPVIVDISEYQAPAAINYDTFAKQVDHVIIRTMDADYEDKSYGKHHTELQKRGVPTAAYAFVRGQNDTHMKNEAKMFYDRTKKYNPTFWWLDVEAVTHSNMRHGVNVYINELRRLGAKNVGLYIAHHLYTQLNLDTSNADAVWIPHYGSGSTTADSKPDFPCDIHQYTEYGKLSGYSGNLDLNRLIGNKKLEYFTDGKSSSSNVVTKKDGRYEWGWHWSGTFTANATIVVRRGNRGTNMPAVGEESWIQKGDWVNFDHLFYKNGYWWIRFKYADKGSSTDYFFMPVGVRDPQVNFSKAKLWGIVTKLNSNEKTSGVTNWHKKEAVK